MPGPDSTISRLVRAFHHRWAVPVLAEMHRLKDNVGGARFVMLVNRLGVSRDSLRRTLAALERAGLIQRNPGYGHPLRPEWILTPAGRAEAAWAARIESALRDAGLGEVGHRKWTLATLAAVASRGDAGGARFSEIAAALEVEGVTPRALAAALKDLSASQLVHRRVGDGYPPTTRYDVSARGRALANALVADG